MKTASAKNKGRTFQQWVCKQIAAVTGFEFGKDKPIESRGMGQNGCDVRLESAVRDIFPFSIECKCQEKWAIHEWINQARKQEEKGTWWLLFCKRNHQEPVVVMSAEAFFCTMLRAIKSERKG